jgi:FkbM family methyltransferase
MISPSSRPHWLMRLYSALLHRAPIRSGLTVLSHNRLTHRLFAGCDGPVEAVMHNGVRIEVDPNDFDGRVLYLFGTNDPKVEATARGLLRPGDRFLDIGANHSTIGILAADRVGPTGQVHLFEPQRTLCDRVQAALDRAGLTNVHLHRVGLMDHDGELVFARPRNHSGMASFVIEHAPERWRTETATVRDIATYVPPLIGEHGFGAKVDVEGAEMRLIPWLVRQLNLRFLIFEAKHNQRQLWDTVIAAGLVPFGLSRRLAHIFQARLARIRAFEELARFHDVVAVRLRAGVEPPDLTIPRALAPLLVNEPVRASADPPAAMSLS